jgi:hypothetical protein
MNINLQGVEEGVKFSDQIFILADSANSYCNPLIHNQHNNAIGIGQSTIYSNSTNGSIYTGGGDNHNLVNEGSSSGLSGGSIAAIVVGTIFGVVAVCFIVYFFIIKRSSKQNPYDGNT